MFEPISDARIPDSIIKQTKRLILAGVLNPGDRLPGERELMKQLRVSRSSLRQALQALESIGYAKTIPGKGTFIQAFADNAAALMGSLMMPWAEGNEKQMNELLEVRLIIETESASLAATRSSSEDKKEVQFALDRIIEAHTSRKLDEMVAANIAFHRSIAKASENTLLLTLTDSITTSLSDLSTFALRISGGLSESVEEHCRIGQAIISGDYMLAREEIRNHLNGVKKLISVYMAHAQEEQKKGDPN